MSSKTVNVNDKAGAVSPSIKKYVWIILAAAILVRLVYVSQIRDLPFFETPVGDEEAYSKAPK